MVGLLFEPYDFLSVGLTVQDELGLELTGRNEVQVRATNNEDVFTQPIEIVQGYHPPRAAASLALRHPVLGLVDLGVNWMGWPVLRMAMVIATSSKMCSNIV